MEKFYGCRQLEMSRVMLAMRYLSLYASMHGKQEEGGRWVITRDFVCIYRIAIRSALMQLSIQVHPQA